MTEQLTENACVEVVTAAAKPQLADVAVLSARRSEKRTLPALIFEVSKFVPLAGSSALGAATISMVLLSRSVPDDPEDDEEELTQAAHAARWDAAVAALSARQFAGQVIAGVKFLGRPFFGEIQHGRTEDTLWISTLTITAGVQPAVDSPSRIMATNTPIYIIQANSTTDPATRDRGTINVQNVGTALCGIHVGDTAPTTLDMCEVLLAAASAVDKADGGFASFAPKGSTWIFFDSVGTKKAKVSSELPA